MIVQVNDETVFTITETQKKVIQNDINSDLFDDDMKRRVRYIVEHKYEQCMKRLKEEWEPILIAEGAENLPTDKDTFAQLVFAHPQYKDRKTKDDEQI